MRLPCRKTRPEHARFEGVQFSRLDTSNTTPELWCRLGRLVHDTLDRDDVDGVVIIHGTNTLEETAYFLYLTVKSVKPVVVLGAMRPASALGSDALPNLFKAVFVAASATARSRGVLVLVGDALFSARDVTKTSTRRLDAFQAPDLGPLGFADTDGRVVFHHRQERAHTLATRSRHATSSTFRGWGHPRRGGAHRSPRPRRPALTGAARLRAGDDRLRLRRGPQLRRQRHPRSRSGPPAGRLTPV
jgi:L-asparaginase/Glu-tRNA(Gln) amidotransferase subunit D